MSTYAAALTASARARRLAALQSELALLGNDEEDWMARMRIGAAIRETINSLQYGKDDR